MTTVAELASALSTWYGEELDGIARMSASQLPGVEVRLVCKDGSMRVEVEGASALVTDGADATEEETDGG